MELNVEKQLFNKGSGPMEKLLRIKKHHNDSLTKHIFLDKFTISSYGFTIGQKVIFVVGSLDFTLILAESEIKESHTILLTKDVLDIIPYYLEGPLLLISISKTRLVLGPCVGVTVPKKGLAHINESASMKKRALEAHKKGVILIYFNLKKVDWRKNKVKGFYYDYKKGKWLHSVFPVPLIIFDRGSNPDESTVASYDSRGKVKTMYWINTTRTLGKWETYLALKSTKLMPYTEELTSTSLAFFMTNFNSCYIKGNYGRNGKQVYKVEQVKGQYICKTGGSEVHVWAFDNQSSLLNFLNERLKNAIIQREVSLSKIDDCPFDLRILAQKNIKNLWEVTSMNIRIGVRGAIVTNFAQGASDVLVFPNENLPSPYLNWESIIALAHRTATMLELYFGNLGELGLDVAIDNNNVLWVLEVNSRPSSKAYRNATEEQASKIFGLPLDYSIYIAREHYKPKK